MIIPVPSTRVTAPTTDTAARVGKLLSFTSHPVMIINRKHVKNESTASAVISRLQARAVAHATLSLRKVSRNETVWLFSSISLSLKS
jgi:hypothetical protein